MEHLIFEHTNFGMINFGTFGLRSKINRVPKLVRLQYYCYRHIVTTNALRELRLLRAQKNLNIVIYVHKSTQFRSSSYFWFMRLVEKSNNPFISQQTVVL